MGKLHFNTVRVLTHTYTGKEIGSGDSGTYDVLKSKMAGATLKGGGFNRPGSTAPIYFFLSSR